MTDEYEERLTLDEDELKVWVASVKDDVATRKIFELAFDNYDAIQASTKCGCFRCEKIFDATEINDWTERKDYSAICPYCGEDSILPDSKIDVTPELLHKLKCYDDECAEAEKIFVDENLNPSETQETPEERQERFEQLSTYKIYQLSFKNYDYIQASKQCGCFYCGKIFDVTELDADDWHTEKDGQRTAFCHYCGIDSVIPDSKVKLTKEILMKLNAEWFSGLGLSDYDSFLGE